VSLKEGDSTSPRGDNSKRVKIHWKFLKIFSRTSRSISIKLGTNYPLDRSQWLSGRAPALWSEGREFEPRSGRPRQT
jgi:hypothetical protein